MTDIKSLPLPIRKSLRDSEKDMARQCQRIKAATGVEYTLEADPVDIHAKATDDHTEMGTTYVFFEC